MKMSTAYMKKAKKSGLNDTDLAKMKSIAIKEIEKNEKIRKVQDDANMLIAWMMMLYIPVNILCGDYWEKTAKTRIPKFIDECLSLWDSYEKGVVTLDELEEVLMTYANVDAQKRIKAIKNEAERKVSLMKELRG